MTVRATCRTCGGLLPEEKTAFDASKRVSAPLQLIVVRWPWDPDPEQFSFFDTLLQAEAYCERAGFPRNEDGSYQGLEQYELAKSSHRTGQTS